MLTSSSTESEPSQERRLSWISNLITRYAFPPTIHIPTRLSLRETGLTNQRESRGERGHSTCPAAIDFRWETDVCLNTHTNPPLSITKQRMVANGPWNRADDKTAQEYQLEGGATLHLVREIWRCGGRG
jgi:hypothetical protein